MDRAARPPAKRPPDARYDNPVGNDEIKALSNAKLNHGHNQCRHDYFILNNVTALINQLRRAPPAGAR
jgi:hypothetical protein